MRFRIALIGTAAASAGTTLAVATLPHLHFAYRSLSLHLVLETTSTLIAALAAYLVLGRFRQQGRLPDLLLVAALAASMLSSLAVAALPEVLFGRYVHGFGLWESLVGGVAAAVLWAAAAYAPVRPVRDRGRGERIALAAFCAGALVLTAFVVLVLSRLPAGIPSALSPADTARPLLVGNPLLVGGQIAAALLLCAAAAGFARRALAEADDFVRWIAVGVVLGAFSRINYVLFPSRYSEWVYLGDLFRTAFYAVLVVGAFREIRSYWARVAEAAVLEERRRLARDLHDGMAQELAFVAAEADGAVAAAARRALDESRLAISALSRPLGEPFGLVLVQAAEEVAHRHGARIRCDVERVDVPRALGDALLRIVREAVGNAARHGRPGTISVLLRQGSLRVSDDGCGFDPDVARGFGLVSIRERAAAAGAELAVESRPGGGASVAVVWP